MKRRGRRRNSQQGKGRFLIFTGIFFLACAAVWTGYIKWEDERAKQRSEELLTQAEAVFLEEQPVDSAEAEPSEMSDGVQGGDMQENVFAILEIPALDLRLPVLNRYSQKLLKQYVCRYGPEYCRDGQVAIAGHNYRSHFRGLSGLEAGERILLVFPEGTQEYTVSEVTEIDGGGREEFFSGEWDLSLFTCDFSGKRRVVVRCAGTQGE